MCTAEMGRGCAQCHCHTRLQSTLLFLVVQYVIGGLWLSIAAQHSKKLSYWKLLAQKNTVQGIVSIECIWHFLCSVKLNLCKSGSLCTYITNVCTYKANMRSHLMQFWLELHTYTHTQPSSLASPPSVLFGTLLHPSSQHHPMFMSFGFCFVLFFGYLPCMSGFGLITGSGATSLKKSQLLLSQQLLSSPCWNVDLLDFAWSSVSNWSCCELMTERNTMSHWEKSISQHCSHPVCSITMLPESWGVCVHVCVYYRHPMPQTLTCCTFLVWVSILTIMYCKKKPL